MIFKHEKAKTKKSVLQYFMPVLDFHVDHHDNLLALNTTNCCLNKYHDRSEFQVVLRKKLVFENLEQNLKLEKAQVSRQSSPNFQYKKIRENSCTF